MQGNEIGQGNEIAQDDENGMQAAKPLTDAARRALAEAEARRKTYKAEEAALPKEIGGRGGNDPQRYGDWEIKGLTSDF